MAWAPLRLSFEIAIVATLVACAVGTSVGALLARGRFFGRELLDALCSAPMVLPPTVLGYYVLVAFGRRGPLGHAFEELTGSTIVFTKTGAIVAATIGAFPLVVKASRAAFEGVDPTLLRAAATLGASPFRAFATVQFPLARRGLVAGATLAFARSLGDFGVTLMVAGDIPGETQTASLAIYDLLQADRDVEAVGMVVVLTAIAVAALYAVNKLSTRAPRSDGRR